MSWTMPHRVLQIVASLIVLAAVSSFTLGVLNAPQRGRLPGERLAPGSKPGVAAADVTEATPLSQERIEGPPPPPPQAKNTVDEDADAAPEPDEQTDEPAAGNAPIGQAGNVVALAPPQFGANLGNSAAPAPEEPPH